MFEALDVLQMRKKDILTLFALENPLRWLNPLATKWSMKRKVVVLLVAPTEEAFAGSSCHICHWKVGWCPVSYPPGILASDLGWSLLLPLEPFLLLTPFSSGTFPNSIQASSRAKTSSGYWPQADLASSWSSLALISPLCCVYSTIPRNNNNRSAGWMHGEKFCACVVPAPMSTLQESAWSLHCRGDELAAAGKALTREEVQGEWTAPAPNLLPLDLKLQMGLQCPLGLSSSSYWRLPCSAHHQGQDFSSHCLGHWTGGNNHWVRSQLLFHRSLNRKWK